MAIYISLEQYCNLNSDIYVTSNNLTVLKDTKKMEKLLL